MCLCINHGCHESWAGTVNHESWTYHTVVKFKGIDVQCQTTYTEKNQNGILIFIQLS